MGQYTRRRQRAGSKRYTRSRRGGFIGGLIEKVKSEFSQGSAAKEEASQAATAAQEGVKKLTEAGAFFTQATGHLKKLHGHVSKMFGKKNEKEQIKKAHDKARQLTIDSQQKTKEGKDVQDIAKKIGANTDKKIPVAVSGPTSQSALTVGGSHRRRRSKKPRHHKKHRHSKKDH